MRILHVITTIERGGAENQLLTLVRQQISNGDLVSIYYLKGNPDLRESFEDYRAHIIRAPNSLILQILKLRKILHSHYDLAHAHLPRSELILAIASLLCTNRIPLVATRHNSEPFFPGTLSLISTLLSRITLFFYSSVIFISKAVERFVRAANEIPKNIDTKVIYYGYDERFIFDRSLGKNFAQIPRRYLFVGRFTFQKNIPILLDSFRKLIESDPKSQLHLYGSGELENQLRFSTSDLANNVFWHGKSGQIYEIMQDSFCLILPSRYEGFGLVLLEAMQTGLPIIASNNSSIPEVLGPKHPGLFDFSDSKKLLELLRLVKDRNFYEEILEYQSHQVRRFEPSAMATTIRAVYSRILLDKHA